MIDPKKHPTVYLSTFNDMIQVRSRSVDDDPDEKYVCEVISARVMKGGRTPAHIEINVLRNVLEAAGVRVILEG